MIRLLLILIAIVAVLIGGVAAAVHFVPSSVYKDKIETAAEAALGRDVVIDGDIKLSIFPKITASAGQTTVANPEGFGSSNFASMTELRAAVKLWPLLSRNVEIDEFILVDPKLSLIQLANGENNWTFSAETPKETTPDNSPSAPSGVSAKLGDVRLINGDLTYDDRKTGQKHTLEKLNIVIKLPQIDGPLGVKGDGVADGLGFDINANVANLQNLIDGISTPVTADFNTDLAKTNIDGNITLGDVIGLDIQANANVGDLPALAKFLNVEIPAATALGQASVKAKVGGQVGALSLTNVIFNHNSDLLKLDFTGGANVGDNITFNGDLDFNAPNLRALAKTADVTLPEGDIYRAFTLKGTTSGSLDSVSLSNAKLSFDDIIGDGEMRLNLAGAKPKLTGTLNTNLIDATKYAAASGATQQPAQKQKTSEGWPDAPLDLSPLKAVDVDLKISAAGLKFQGIDIGKTALNTTILNGKLIADLTETSLYGGKGTAKIIADASAATPKVQMVASLNALNAAPFLGAVANFDKIEGLGGFNITLDGTGNTMSSIMSSLSGSGAFKFDDGAIKGLNAAQLMRSASDFLKTGTMPTALSAEQETDFTEFAAGFNIANGVASTQDFNFITPGLQIPGKGELNLGARTLSLSMFPKSGDKSLGINGFAPPIKISGGWNNLSVGLDQDWLKQQLTQQLTNEAGKLLEKELGVDGLKVGGENVDVGTILGDSKESEKARRNALNGALTDALSKQVNKNKKDTTTTDKAATPQETSTPTPAPEQTDSTASAETVQEEEEEPKSLEEQLEEEAKKKLKDLFK